MPVQDTVLSSHKHLSMSNFSLCQELLKMNSDRLCLREGMYGLWVFPTDKNIEIGANRGRGHGTFLLIQILFMKSLSQWMTGLEKKMSNIAVSLKQERL